jgi:2,3-bisphosphoglycerate-dependent phosphoglycerate mutase
MFGIFPDAVYTSLLQRSIKTYEEIAKPENGNIRGVPVIHSWRLNERHYGALMGLAKDEAEAVMGKEKVRGWRRSWDLAPPRMLKEDEYYWREAPWAQPITIYTEPGKATVTTSEKRIEMPTTESLQDCAKRVQPIWEQSIAPKVARGETVLVVAHANSIRSMIKHIDSETVSDESVRDIQIPSSTPLVYNFTLKDPSLLHLDPHSLTTNTTTIPAAKLLKPIGEPSRLGMTGRYLASKEIARLQLKASVPAEDEYINEKNGTNDTTNTIPSSTQSYSSFFNLIDKGLTEIIDYADNSPHGKREALIIADGKGIILHANDAWQALYGFESNELKGKTSKLFEGPLTNEKEVNRIYEQLKTGLPTKTTIVNYSKDGKAYQNNMTIIPVYDWINEDETNQLIVGGGGDLDSNVLSSLSSSSSSGSFLDYGGADNFHERQQFNKFIQPSFYVARLDSHLEITPSMEVHHNNDQVK